MREDANYLRFHLSPHSTIALGARVKRAGKEFAGDQREFSLQEEEPGEHVASVQFCAPSVLDVAGDRTAWGKKYFRQSSCTS